MGADARIAELKLTLPPAPKPMGTYLPCVRVGDMLYVSGHGPLRPDGTFTVRYSLPDSRQIIPAVAASPDGVEERTIVLAVERNTKELEPMIHDGNEL